MEEGVAFWATLLCTDMFVNAGLEAAPSVGLERFVQQTYLFFGQSPT